jgi:hypothetical protein
MGHLPSLYLLPHLGPLFLCIVCRSRPHYSCACGPISGRAHPAELPALAHGGRGAASLLPGRASPPLSPSLQFRPPPPPLSALSSPAEAMPAGVQPPVPPVSLHIPCAAHTPRPCMIMHRPAPRQGALSCLTHQACTPMPPPFFRHTGARLAVCSHARMRNRTLLTYANPVCWPASHGPGHYLRNCLYFFTTSIWHRLVEGGTNENNP